MTKKLFLTSFIAMTFFANAYAEPSHTGEFPNDGLMQEDYTYTNAATETNMDGVYEGSVNATAEYENISYQLAAGQYLPANSETPTTCDQNGYYCAGNQNGVNYQSYAQGLTQCPNGYANSDNGASSEDQCYRTCSGNVNIAHATDVTGNDYYGNGTDTCVPTGCDHGYHIPVEITPSEITTAVGITDAGSVHAYVNNSGDAFRYNSINDENESVNPSDYGLSASDHNSFMVDYGNNGIIKGHGRCSTRSATDSWTMTGYNINIDNIVSELTDETGQNDAQYCYCHLDSYTPVNGNAIALTRPWLYGYGVDDAENCADECAAACAYYLYSSEDEALPFRAAMFGTIETGAQCTANTITINWRDVDPQYAGQNNEGTATYGGDINTPFKAVTKPGKRFIGWRFSAPSVLDLLQ